MPREEAPTDIEYDDARALPNAQMRRRAHVSEAAFVLIAAILNGPEWIVRTGRFQGRPRATVVIDELPYDVTDSQSLNHVVAVLAAIEAERQLLGEASFLGGVRFERAVELLRRRFAFGLEPDLVALRDGELTEAQKRRLGQRLADAGRQATALASEHADHIGRMADILEARPRMRGRQLAAAIQEALDGG